MLTVTKLADAEYTLTQVAEGIEEYYLGVGESPGVWHGQWAAQLGLEGVVVADDLRALLDGLDPAGGVTRSGTRNGLSVRWLVLCLTGWLGLAMVTASAACAEDYPSPSGAVGPTDYVEVTNSGYAVWDKTGQVIQSPQFTNTLWTGYPTTDGNACATEHDYVEGA